MKQTPILLLSLLLSVFAVPAQTQQQRDSMRLRDRLDNITLPINEFKNGDLIFLNGENDNMDKAIRESTGNYTHVAALLWQRFTTRAKGHCAALYLDGVEVQNWQIQCGIDNGCFFIMKNWSSKEELETFIRRLVRQ